MQRHPVLVPLSREHHHALSLCQRIRRAPEADHDSAIAEARDALLQHFAAEESQFAAWWPQLNRPDLQQRFEQDHALLRHLLQPPFQAAPLAEALMAHVRFEERELFPAFETLF